MSVTSLAIEGVHMLNHSAKPSAKPCQTRLAMILVLIMFKLSNSSAHEYTHTPYKGSSSASSQ
jgi:hypothetical protein